MREVWAGLDKHGRHVTHEPFSLSKTCTLIIKRGINLRLKELRTLGCLLTVGFCVPFYFIRVKWTPTGLEEHLQF